MKKIISIAFAIFFSFSNLAYAEMRYGISGAITMIDATGTETEGGEKTNGSADNVVIIPSILVDVSEVSGARAVGFVPEASECWRSGVIRVSI